MFWAQQIWGGIAPECPPGYGPAATSWVAVSKKENKRRTSETFYRKVGSEREAPSLIVCMFQNSASVAEDSNQ